MMSGSRPVSASTQNTAFAKAFAFAWNRFQVQCRSPAAENSTSDTVVESFRQSKKFSTFQNITWSESAPEATNSHNNNIIIRAFSCAQVRTRRRNAGQET